MNDDIVLNDEGLRELLKSPEMQQGLDQIAKRIAEAAGPGNIPGVDIGRVRARGYVVTATPHAMEAEARDRTLTRAVEAGR